MKVSQVPLRSNDVFGTASEKRSLLANSVRFAKKFDY